MAASRCTASARLRIAELVANTPPWSDLTCRCRNGCPTEVFARVNLWFRGPESNPQLGLGHFAGRVARQHADDLEGLGMFVMGQPFGEEFIKISEELKNRVSPTSAS